MPIDPADPYAPRRRSVVPILLLVITALLVGMGMMAWLFHRYDQVADVLHPSVPTVIAPEPAQPVPVVRLATPPVAEIVGGIVDQRIDKIEERVDEIGARADAASSEAERAEGLLIAFAARRAIDRGVSLGYLEGVLRDRFGGVEPQSVATVISASRQPMTIEQLHDELDKLSPQLSSAAPNESWWEGFRRELASLVVIQQANVHSTAPVDRISRAKDALAAGRVDSALTEIARLPARSVAQGWIGNARRYVQTRVALDRIETAALLRPKGATAN